LDEERLFIFKENAGHKVGTIKSGFESTPISQGCISFEKINIFSAGGCKSDKVGS